MADRSSHGNDGGTRQAKVNDEFADRVLVCVGEFNDSLAPLVARFGRVEVLAALAETLGGAMRYLMERREMPPRTARALLKRAESAAFTKTLFNGNGRTPRSR